MGSTVFWSPVKALCSGDGHGCETWLTERSGATYAHKRVENLILKRNSGIRASANAPGRQCGGLSASEDLYRTGHIPRDQVMGNTPYSSG